MQQNVVKVFVPMLLTYPRYADNELGIFRGCRRGLSEALLAVPRAEFRSRRKMRCEMAFRGVVSLGYFSFGRAKKSDWGCRGGTAPRSWCKKLINIFLK